MTTQDAIARCGFFAKLPSADKEALAGMLELQAAARGEVIIKAETESTSLLFLVDGKVKVCTTDGSGKEAILSFLGPGECLGELSLITGAKRSADVVALSRCELLVMSKDSFIAFCNRHPGLLLTLLNRLALRLQAASKRITDLALYDVSSRLTRVLIEIATPLPEDAKGVFIVNDRPTHQELASMVGSTREVVTRALNNLELSGHISVDQGCITINSIP